MKEEDQCKWVVFLVRLMKYFGSRKYILPPQYSFAGQIIAWDYNKETGIPYICLVTTCNDNMTPFKISRKENLSIYFTDRIKCFNKFLPDRKTYWGTWINMKSRLGTDSFKANKIPDDLAQLFNSFQ